MIGHAAKDEKGKYTGGKAGDQTGREVYTRTWYDRPWNCVIRFRDPEKREKIARAMEAACENDNIGYDQSQRNTLHAAAKKVGWDLAKVQVPCETDCSALVSDCCIFAGVPESVLYRSGNLATTTNLRVRLEKTKEVSVLNAKKYLKSDKELLRGDILLYEGHHVAVNLAEGKTEKIEQEERIESAASFDKAVAGEYEVQTFMNMRAGAGLDKQIITQLPEGTIARCYGYSTDGWLLVEVAGKTGFCSGKYLKKKERA